MIFVGTSGWQYDSWKERFYPRDLPKTGWLPYFSARFSTVEVNNTFYRLPSADVFARWRTDSAPDFLIAVKASRYITHLKRLRDPAPSIEMMWTRAQRLEDKLGPVLFQLPPNFRADAGLLRDFLAQLPRTMIPAMEFRDPTWDTDEVYELLDRFGVALVAGDRPGWRLPKVETGGWSYIRFHQGSRIGPHYRMSKLRRWADYLAASDARITYVYFNNDPEGAAIKDAYSMIRLLEERGCDVAPAATISARRASG